MCDSCEVCDSCYYEFTKEHLGGIEEYFKKTPPLDNSRNKAFNKKIYNLKPGKLNVLDIGCGGGEAIEDFLEDKHLGIGIDGNPLYIKYSDSWKKKTLTIILYVI
ncbi:MAG: hypothetical protein HW387_979 [Parachlamydiales bacterium]|nr:hypothetical protein [Parachlamydiales bacterium]